LWILVLALAGVGFAGASSWVHYRILTDPTYVSPCDINASFNCSQAYLSSYGSVAGVPVALGGLAWFVLVALIAAFARPSGAGRSVATAYVFALSTVALAAVLYLAYASFAVLGTGCLLCMGTYAAVIGIFVVSGAASSVGVGQLPARLSSDVQGVFNSPATFLVAILYLVGTASTVALFPREGDEVQAAEQVQAPPQDAAEAFAAAWAQQPREDLGVPADGAKVVIVKFLDWQCPSCKAAYFAYKPVLDQFAETHPGAVKVVVKDYPLSSRCNFGMTTELHQAACEESVLVRLAREVDREQEAVDWLFSQPNQQGVTVAQVRDAAESLLGVTDFDAAYARLIPDIQRDVADGQALRVNSTPTYFINGVRAQTESGWLPPAYFELAITLELEKTPEG
jgi:uncharacterized membrane protein/thiol-disulfide isomerase/thioredoxin